MIVLLLTIIFAISDCIKISPLVPAYTQQCFYEHFYHQSKYRFFMAPKKSDTFVNFTFDLQFVTDNGEKIIYSQSADHSVDQSVQLHKFASEEGLHGFCVTNNEHHEVAFEVKLQSGMQLMELNLLPAHNDTQLVEDQINILKQQYKIILDSLTSVEGARAITQEVFQMMGSKTLGFGIIGISVIILINLVFYRLIKKSLEERKRI